MGIVARLLAAGVAVLASCGSAGAQDSKCETATACFLQAEDEFLAIFDLPAAESRLAAGDQVHRVMYFGRNLSPVVAVEYRRARGREPTVSIYLPRRNGEVAPEPAVSAAVPPGEWERLAAAGGHFDRSLLPAPPDRQAGDEINVCADGGLDVVETIDPARGSVRLRLRQGAESTCDNGLVNAYGDQLRDAALRLIPACTTLEGREGNARILANCAMLQGDRMAAAEAHNKLRRLRFSRDLRDVISLFSEGGSLDWSGKVTSGGRAAGAAWHAATEGGQGGSLFLRRLDGETPDRVRVKAVLEKWTQGPNETSILWAAPVELLLEAERWRGSDFEITVAKVGAFVQVPARCQPGRLDELGC